jgi:beta-glucosidase
VTIEAEINNEGPLDGEQTVFCFLRDPVASVSRPALDLKGFAKVKLAAGTRQRVSFTLKPADFALLDRNLEPVIEPGAFEILIGPSADRARLVAATVHCRARGSLARRATTL